MKGKKLLSVILVCALAVALLGITAYAVSQITAKAANTTAAVEDNVYHKGESITVTIGNDAMSKYAYTFNISFDTDALTCTGVSLTKGGTALSDMESYTSGVLTVYSSPAEANTNGTVGFAIVDPDGVTYSADDVQAVITFEVKNDIAESEITSKLTLHEDSYGASDTAAQIADTDFTITLSGEEAAECEHVWGAATIETYTVDNGEGLMTRTCTLCGETQSITQFAWMDGCTVSLNGKIALNYYVKLPSSADHVVLNGETIAATAGQSNGEHKFTTSFAAAEVQDFASIQILDSNNNAIVLVDKNGKDYTSGYPYSVRTYIEGRVANSTNTKLVNLMKTMGDYGVCAKLYFEYESDVPAAALYNDITAVTASDLSAYAAVVGTAKPSGLTYGGATLVLNSDTTVKVYFTVDDISKYTFKVDGETVTPVASGSEYYIAISNIAAAELDKMYNISVTKTGDSNTFTVQYSALSYAYNIINKGTAKTTLINTCKALYLYNQAADIYFG